MGPLGRVPARRGAHFRMLLIFCSAEGKGFLKENPVFLKNLQEKERELERKRKRKKKKRRGRKEEEENKTPHASSALGHGDGFEIRLQKMSQKHKNVGFMGLGRGF